MQRLLNAIERVKELKARNATFGEIVQAENMLRDYADSLRGRAVWFAIQLLGAAC